jgi:uroporphyrinogen decarboxylase
MTNVKSGALCLLIMAVCAAQLMAASFYEQQLERQSQLLSEQRAPFINCWLLCGPFEAPAAPQEIKRWGTVDGFCLCSDYCFNDNPFLPPEMFAEFIAPYLAELVAGYRELGFYVIKHTDGNIMPILDQLLAAKPHALHSLDPQGGVDLAELKREIGDQVCLIGNVNCALMQTGSDEEFEDDVRRALREGMPGGGYVFSTSNCIYTGLSLQRYERMLEIWRECGEYQHA